MPLAIMIGLKAMFQTEVLLTCSALDRYKLKEKGKGEEGGKWREEERRRAGKGGRKICTCIYIGKVG